MNERPNDCIFYAYITYIHIYKYTYIWSYKNHQIKISSFYTKFIYLICMSEWVSVYVENVLCIYEFYSFIVSCIEWMSGPTFGTLFGLWNKGPFQCVCAKIKTIIYGTTTTNTGYH